MQLNTFAALPPVALMTLVTLLFIIVFGVALQKAFKDGSAIATARPPVQSGLAGRRLSEPPVS
jgi:hypothetical protein